MLLDAALLMRPGKSEFKEDTTTEGHAYIVEHKTNKTVEQCNLK